MKQVTTFGTAIFQAADGTALVGSITTMVSENLPALLIVIGFGV